MTFDRNVQGNRIEDGRMILGMRAGPEVGDVDSLLHEMGHFIEIDDARCTSYGWGLDVRMAYFPGHPPCHDPQTFQACEREIRVTAIQQALATHFNNAFDDYFHAKLIWDWVPGSCYIPKDGLPKFGDQSISLDDRIKARCDRIVEFITQEAEKWSIEKIRTEWNRKCKIHDQRMARDA